ncbi:hypothetical protein MMC20_004163 [Loxospora ochrophaea]|nr:hypothetical protein [Loxospora ochrophaea]
MPYIILIFAYRKPGLSPAAFKSHYESSHVPLVQSITGPHFPNTHTRHYIQRAENTAASPSSSNTDYPATVMVGAQEDFAYDAFAELTFDDAAAFHAFYALVNEEEAAKKIAQDEEMFVDRAKMRVAIVDDCAVTAMATPGSA